MRWARRGDDDDVADGTPFSLTCIRVAPPSRYLFSLDRPHLDIIALALDLQRPGLVRIRLISY
jgi:hypothetical protein